MTFTTIDIFIYFRYFYLHYISSLYSTFHIYRSSSVLLLWHKKKQTKLFAQSTYLKSLSWMTYTKIIYILKYIISSSKNQFLILLSFFNCKLQRRAVLSSLGSEATNSLLSLKSGSQLKWFSSSLPPTVGLRSFSSDDTSDKKLHSTFLTVWNLSKNL